MTDPTPTILAAQIIPGDVLAAPDRKVQAVSRLGPTVRLTVVVGAERRDEHYDAATVLEVSAPADRPAL